MNNSIVMQGADKHGFIPAVEVFVRVRDKSAKPADAMEKEFLDIAMKGLLIFDETIHPCNRYNWLRGHVQREHLERFACLCPEYNLDVMGPTS